MYCKNCGMVVEPGQHSDGSYYCPFCGNLEYMDRDRCEEEIHEVTDANGDIWEVTDVDSVPCWVRRKETEEWQEVTWHIFCQNHGIDPDCLG